MSEMHRAAIGMLKQFINERALAVDMVRVLQAVEEAPSEMHRTSKRLTVLRQELADMEDEKDKLGGTVTQARVDAAAQLEQERAHLATETETLRAVHVDEEQAAAVVWRERKLDMEAEEARHLASLNAIRAQIRVAKKELEDVDQSRALASGSADGGVSDGGKLQRKLGRPRGRRRLYGDDQRASDEVAPGGNEQHQLESSGAEG